MHDTEGSSSTHSYARSSHMWQAVEAVCASIVVLKSFSATITDRPSTPCFPIILQLISSHAHRKTRNLCTNHRGGTPKAPNVVLCFRRVSEGIFCPEAILLRIASCVEAHQPAAQLSSTASLSRTTALLRLTSSASMSYGRSKTVPLEQQSRTAVRVTPAGTADTSWEVRGWLCNASVRVQYYSIPTDL